MALFIELAPTTNRSSSQHTLPEASVVQRELSMPLSDTSIRRKPCRQPALIGTTMFPGSSTERRQLRAAAWRIHRETSEHDINAGELSRPSTGAIHPSYVVFEASHAPELIQREREAGKLAAESF